MAIQIDNSPPSSGNGNGLSQSQVIALMGATPVLYTELVNLIDALALVPGRQYLITDYATTHTIPTTATLNTGVNEPIIVTAVSTTALNAQASSSLYPQDILYYNINNSAPAGTLMGYIYRRIDTFRNIDVPFDYRNVKFRRYKSDMTSAGMHNDYYLWATSITFSYNIGTNASYTFVWDGVNYVDVYPLLNSAIPDARDVKLSAFYTERGEANWNPANYNIYFAGSVLYEVNLSSWSFNYTIKATTNIYELHGGNINATIINSTATNPFIGPIFIPAEHYVGITNSILNQQDGNLCQGVHLQNCDALFINVARLANCYLANLSKISITMYYARNTRLRGVTNLGLDAGTGETSIEIEAMGGIPLQSFNGLRINDYIYSPKGWSGLNWLCAKNGKSNIPFTYDITGIATLDFDAYKKYILGVAMISSTYLNENINLFLNIPQTQDFITKPVAALTGLTITASGSILLGSGVISIVLNGANGDYAVFKAVAAGVAQLLYVVKN
jgi:hypothetical protein